MTKAQTLDSPSKKKQQESGARKLGLIELVIPQMVLQSTDLEESAGTCAK